MIGFISSGFNPPSSLTLEEISFMKRSSKIIVDTYTSSNYLKEFEGRELVFASRSDLEDFGWILNEEGDISIVIPGDSFSATTHFTIYKECRKKGLQVRVFHNSSIFPAAATALGLQLYKVGPPVSIPRFTDNFKPTSPYLKIKENIERGLHTILLLDTEPPMTLNEALDEIFWMESSYPEKIFTEDREIGVVMALGTEKERVVYGKISDVRTLKPESPTTIVIPGVLHFEEIEALDLFRI
ncbi:MAG: diphthine synthase [Thermoplasmatales archaeon]